MKKFYMGFTILELMIAAAIVGLLIAFAIPNFIGSRTKIYRDMCINNLRQIKLAKEQWALENNKNNGDPCTAANLDPYVEDDIWDEGTGGYTAGSKLACPSDPGGTVGSSYTINNIGTNPTCNINPGEHHL